ncbi:MAG: HAMP domain-containing sensor histidine kinase [Micropruina sp.]
MTLRARFALWICLTMLVTLGAFGGFVYLSVSHWLWSSLDAELTEQLRSRGLTIQIFSRSGAVLQSLGPHAQVTLEPADLHEALAGRSELRTRADPEGTGSVRVLTPSRDEVGRLAATFDDMLGRLGDAFQRERRFSHDAAHELRTPLAAMQSILSVIAEQRRTPAEYEVALADLSEETEKLRLLTEDLLRLARAEASEPLWEALDLGELVPDVVDSLRPLADPDRVSLTCLTEGDLAVVGDTDALIRLLVNLLDNAIKYTPAGSIMVAVQGLPDEVTIRIADTGDGIAAEHLPHVFDRFYRADESRTTLGTGLGLAICREIARSHGGNIEVESEPGAGSVFTVRLSRDPRA